MTSRSLVKAVERLPRSLRLLARTTGAPAQPAEPAPGEELCRGLPVEFRLMDYREVVGSFHHLVSMGMFEHVGYKNYATYLDVARRCLRPNGLFVPHTIGSSTPLLPPVAVLAALLRGRLPLPRMSLNASS